MKRHLTAGILVIFLALMSSICAVHGKDENFERLYTSEDGFLQIYSDHAVDQARCKSISARVMAAYEFIAKQEGWHNPALLREKPLQFRLVGGNLKVLGYAQGPNLMVMKDEYLDDPLSEGTLAHELTHIQDLRQLQGTKLPSFMLEGRALTNGKAYRVHLGQPDNSYDHKMAGSALHYTADDAVRLLGEYRGQGWDNQAMGTVFVEYMRTGWNGAGVPDINRRLSKMIENMAGGVEFDPAFQKEFGASFTTVAEAFAKHLTATAGDPQARLKGTIWQSTNPSEGPPPADDDE